MRRRPTLHRWLLAALPLAAGCAALGGVLTSLERPPAPLDEASVASDARLDSTGALLGSFIGEGTSREVHLVSSDTALIAALARWAGVDPYPVLFGTLGGSGYDIACAYAEGPVTYRLEDQTPVVQKVTFHPSFAQNLFFVYLGKKQDSREGIRRYRARAPEHAALTEEISELTLRFLAAADLQDFESAIREHESIIGRALDLPRAKSLYFNDFWGEIKSLGAWGGDFILAASARPEAETRAYFSRRGFDTFLSWRDMVAGGN